MLFRSNNQLIVKNTETTKTGTITVCNMVGQVVMSVPMNSSITTINKNFTSGVYMVMVQVDGNVTAKKVMMN